MGTPSGGQWAPTRHSEDDISLDAGKPCRACGASTKRSSGLCRKCDPAKAAQRAEKERRSVYKDGSARSVPPEDVRQCTYQFVAVYRSGEATGGYRQCANAVAAPASLCHRHGGARETSLGRSFAKASAEAARGECFPLRAEYWEQADARMEAAEGDLMRILSTDCDRLAQALVAARRQAKKDSPARMSMGNQMLILAQHFARAKTSGLSDEDAWSEVAKRSCEPHMTAAAWARAGRAPVEGADGVAAIWYKQYTKRSEDDEAQDEDNGIGGDDKPHSEREDPRSRVHTRWAIGSVLEYPLSETEGEDYEVAESPIGTFRPNLINDDTTAPERLIGDLERVAVDMGVQVRYVERKPAEGYAFWQAHTNEIVVWNGIAGGDTRAVAHSLAHEIGHARLGHGTEDAKDESRPDKEAAAESFAALVCAHYGIDTSEMSALYVSDWRKGQGIGPVRTTAAFRSALQAYDDYVTEMGQWQRDALQVRNVTEVEGQ